VLLGRGADDEKVDHWLTQAAPVEGFVGFAIGRSIWGDPLKQFIDGALEREEAAERIGRKYTRFVKVYEGAEAPAAA
jgi:5-dehydro-2-deoxygluconokinase